MKKISLILDFQMGYYNDFEIILHTSEAVDMKNFVDELRHSKFLEDKYSSDGGYVKINETYLDVWCAFGNMKIKKFDDKYKITTTIKYGDFEHLIALCNIIQYMYPQFNQISGSWTCGTEYEENRIGCVYNKNDLHISYKELYRN